METEQLKDAFEVPREFASAIERLDGAQMKRSVELMGQCVQVMLGRICAATLLECAIFCSSRWGGFGVLGAPYAPAQKRFL